MCCDVRFRTLAKRSSTSPVSTSDRDALLRVSPATGSLRPGCGSDARVPSRAPSARRNFGIGSETHVVPIAFRTTDFQPKHPCPATVRQLANATLRLRRLAYRPRNLSESTFNFVSSFAFFGMAELSWNAIPRRMPDLRGLRKPSVDECRA